MPPLQWIPLHHFPPDHIAILPTGLDLDHMAHLDDPVILTTTHCRDLLCTQTNPAVSIGHQDQTRKAQRDEAHLIEPPVILPVQPNSTRPHLLAPPPQSSETTLLSLVAS
jgi:hypothetical protein